MKKLFFRIAILSALLWVVVVFFGPQLNPLYAEFGNPAEIRSMLTSVLLIVAVASLVLTIARTILAIIFTVLLAVALFFLAHYFVF